ncbi:protein trichome birefringence-like 19 [Rhodamnia argentea]|uniref:Protein trichome birefringence-like 19 n=1 Tax=Rhodamnia argentea TaxID=178133 RepID=A0A8B8MNX9_9MYRT|nr:protein trichome birefringence-like 19 [Rhodamnia argentea]
MWKTPGALKSQKLVLLSTLLIVLLSVFSLYDPFLLQPLLPATSSPKASSSSPKFLETCNIFNGEWVPNPDGPYYTNDTCWAIHDHQNCMKHGRPDTEFMKWRWKPDSCELPIFDPTQFLELVQGKSLAFVGDSVGRNHMQSLVCLLSKVEYPTDVSSSPDPEFKRLKYESYNFTIATFWSPYLVKFREADADGPTHTGLFNLYLDEFDEEWTTQIDKFDYVIISSWHWFSRPVIFSENRQIVGCNFCRKENITDLTMFYGYRKAFRTAFRAINSLKNYKGITFLRTFAPSHFENGEWNEGGNCLRTRPFRSDEATLEGRNLEVYMVQIEEFKRAQAEGRKRGLKFRLLDSTQAMLLRPDGHPSSYGHWPQENVTLYNDCVHWCLPGPIDVWNDFLLEMLKVERVLDKEELHYQDGRLRAG